MVRNTKTCKKEDTAALGKEGKFYWDRIYITLFFFLFRFSFALKYLGVRDELAHLTEDLC